MNKLSGKTRLIIALSSAVLALSVASLIYFQRQFVSDSIVNFFFSPSIEVREIESSIGLTNEGKRIFYATQPELTSSRRFNQRCPRQEDKSPIIGCYTSDDRVYIYKISNADLDGIEEVTASHEMLHAVWSRHNDSEKKRLTSLLDGAYGKLADNNELHERMEYYKRTEPGEFYNEIHSILGTEVADLGQELEKYYAQYFNNRQQILAFHQQYYSIYESLNTRANELQSQMEALSANISAALDFYNDELHSLNIDINSFNIRANAGDFPSMSAFYSERSALTSRSEALEQNRLELNQEIERYGILQDEYTDIANKIEILNKSLDSFESIEKPPTV